MGKTIKNIADEIGVSKQAVYKRLTGKLKNVCAPYIYTEYNCMCIKEEGERIVKEDFIKNPCATSLRSESVPHMENVRNVPAPSTEQMRSAYPQNTEHIGSVSVSDMEHIRNNPAPDTEYIQNQSKPNTEYKYIRFDTEQSNAPAPNTYVPEAEHIGSTTVPDTEQSDVLLEKLHQMELELVKAQAEIEKRDEKIEHLQQRIGDKEQIIDEQKESIARIDSERKVLTASLFRNNAFIEDLLHLPLMRRIFGWNNVQKQLRDTQNDTQSDIADEQTVIVDIDGSKN